MFFCYSRVKLKTSAIKGTVLRRKYKLIYILWIHNILYIEAQNWSHFVYKRRELI